MDNFKEKLQEAGSLALDNVLKYFKGEINGSDKIKHSIQIAAMEQRQQHIEMIDRNVNRSFVLRLAHLIQDPKERAKYVEETKPLVMPKLLNRLEKTKDKD